MDSGPPQKGSRRAQTLNHPNHPHPTCWEHCVTLWLCRHDCFSCTAVPVFQAGGLGLTSRTTSRARTVRLILSNPELSSFDLKPPTRSYGKRSRPDRHQVATTRVRLHALVVLASSHEPVKKKGLNFWLEVVDTYLQKDTPNRRSVKCRPIERLRATVQRVGSLHLPG